MSNLRKRAMEAVLDAADHDIRDTLAENGVPDPHSEDADETVLDVAILYAYRIFVRICEQHGVTADPHLFTDMAVDLADEMALDEEHG